MEFGCAVVLESTHFWSGLADHGEEFGGAASCVPASFFAIASCKRLAAELVGEVEAGARRSFGRNASTQTIEETRSPICSARPSTASRRGVRDEAAILDVFPFEQVDDVVMWVSRLTTHAEEMRAVREPGERRREDLVPLRLQPVGDASPAPAAVIGAMDQHEGLARPGLRRRLRPPSAAAPTPSAAPPIASRRVNELSDIVSPLVF